MSGVIRKGAVVAASAALAFGGIAAPATAAGKGHHSKWSATKCTKHAAKWAKSHPHPTKKQEKAESKLLLKHGCM